MKIITIQNFTCRLGKTAKENWELFDNSRPEYLFFHLSSFSSGYLILECEDVSTVNKACLQEAAQLCKQNTKYRNIKHAKVDYTTCDNLTKGDYTGEIIYKKYRKVKHI